MAAETESTNFLFSQNSCGYRTIFSRYAHTFRFGSTNGTNFEFLKEVLSLFDTNRATPRIVDRVQYYAVDPID